MCRSCAEPRQQAHVRLGGRHRDPGARQIRIDVEVEPGRPPLDAAQYQVLHRIKADCAEPQGVADRTLDLLEPEGLQ